jgi:hypothetical protein
MKTILLLSAFVAALAASASLASANPASADSSDAQMTRTLAVAGQIAVANVGDYVETGSFRVWVSSHLGRPDHVLPDGTWLYENRQVQGSAVGGTLAISFANGRVNAMRLLSPATETALLRPAKPVSNLMAAR